MPHTSRSHQPLKFWLAISLPPILAIGFILHFSVDVPFWDEWDTPGFLFERIIEGSVNYQDFFSQHNESRMIFPKLIFVAIGFTLGWHVTIFMVLSWFCVLLSFLIVLKLLQEGTGEHQLMFLFIALLLGALLFSPSQWVNQLSGIQLAQFIPAFCLASCLWLQSTQLSYGIKVITCALLSIISTFSFANGMVVWLPAFPFFRIWLTGEWNTSPHRKRVKIIWWTALYLGLTAATIGFYFWDYQKPGYHPSLSVVFKHPLLGSIFFTALIGSPLCYGRGVYAIIVGTGIFFLLLFSFILIGIKVKNSSENAVLKFSYPWICFIAYGILSGLAITAGRVGFGVGTALSSKYTSVSIWVTLGLVGILYMLWGCEVGKRRDFINVSFRIVIGLFSVLTLLSWFNGYKDMRAASLRSQQNLLTLRLLNVAHSNPLLNRLHPEPHIVRDRASLLMEHGILKIDPIGVWINDKIRAPDGQDAGWFSVNTLNEKTINVAGWAILPNQGVPADFVILAKTDQSGNNGIITGLLTTIERPDVAERTGNPQLLLSGFEKTLGITFVEGDHFSMFAVDLKNQRLYELRQGVSFSHNLGSLKSLLKRKIM